MKKRLTIFFALFIFVFFSASNTLAFGNEYSTSSDAVRVDLAFDLAGGNVGGFTNLQIFNHDTSTNFTQTPTPTRQGYVFDGWAPFDPQGMMITMAQTFTAQWVPAVGADLTVTFVLNGGDIAGNTANVVVTVPNGAIFTAGSLPATPTRAGHTFTGWLPADIVGTAIVANATVTAQWSTATTVNITFNLDGGNINGNTQNPIRTIVQGTVLPTVDVPATPTRAGYTFAGWYPANIVAGAINQHTTVTAQWASDTAVNVTFNLDGGHLEGNMSNIVRAVPQGSTLATTDLPPSPVRAGYTFTGWYPANIIGSAINQNVTLTAQWLSDIPTATVTFSLAGGHIGGNMNQIVRTVNIGHTLPITDVPADPARAGYVFTGWLPENITALPIVANTIVEAQWVSEHFIVDPIAPIAPITPIDPTPTTPLVGQAVTLAPGGTVFIGGMPLAYDPNIFGNPHITPQGASVLPARLSLAILFGISPQEALHSDLLQWDAATNTFWVDPFGRDIRLTVGSYTMYVGGTQFPILSGEGFEAFPVSVFIEPATERMFIPTRAIADALGFSVGWDPAAGAVMLIPPVQ